MGNEFLMRKEETVDGIYPLGAVIRRSVRGTVYETQFGESALPAVIKIREIAAADAEDLLGKWREVMELGHPNLLKVYATGSSVFEGVPVVYVVMERADESLEGVLAERALSADETREMLLPALEALRYLHKNGYVHSRLRPSNVLSAGDQLKLSSDSVTRVEHAGATAEDMRDLGVLVAQALTPPQPNGGGIPDLSQAPQPFAEIVRHCLDPDPGSRWTVEQVEAALRAPVVEPVSVTPAQPAREIPPVAVRSAPPAVEAPGREDRQTSGVPKWIYVAVAALALTVLLVLVMRNTNSAPVAAVPKAPPAVVPAAAVPKAVPEQVSKPAPWTEPKTALPAVAHGRKAEGWSVIVAAYGSRDQAEKRMREMAKKWPAFTVSVFQPQAGETHFVVVLGQNLSEDQAETLRKRAVNAGMPRDTYIKRVL